MPSPEMLKLYGAIAAAILLVIGAVIVTHKIDNATLLKQQAAWATAQSKAVAQAQRVQQAEDKVSLDAAVSEATAQQNIIIQTNTITQEVIRHVPVASKCSVSVGFVRVLNAAVLGNTASDLSYSPGQSDDACADTDARTLALNIVANYGACNANAEQLGALQTWVRSIIDASKTK